MRGRFVAYVEDDPDDVELALLNFRACGVDLPFVPLRDGLAAVAFLEKALKQGEEALPALILLDLKMPRMNGLELMRWIHREPRLRSIPVLFFTSSADERDKEEAFRWGARRFLKKPVDFDSFQQIADELMKVLASSETRPA